MATLSEIKAKEEVKRLRSQKVCNDYLRLSSDHPEASANTLFETLAEKYRNATGTEDIRLHLPSTSQGVKLVIARNGLYQPRKTASAKQS